MTLNNESRIIPSSVPIFHFKCAYKMCKQLGCIKDHNFRRSFWKRLTNLKIGLLQSWHIVQYHSDYIELDCCSDGALYIHYTIMWFYREINKCNEMLSTDRLAVWYELFLPFLTSVELLYFVFLSISFLHDLIQGNINDDNIIHV